MDHNGFTWLAVAFIVVGFGVLIFFPTVFGIPVTGSGVALAVSLAIAAAALAHKRDDRVRKEFEKSAVMTHSNNRAIINQRKGADAGIDGVTFFRTAANENGRIIF